jgi:hypothetical protein
MRKTKWFVAAALMMSTAGCVETMDGGYAAPSCGYGYGNGYYSSGYYAQPAYYSPPVVYNQTRYVPVPTPAPQHYADRANDHRWEGRHDEPRHVEHQTSAPQPATPTARRPAAITTATAIATTSTAGRGV